MNMPGAVNKEYNPFAPENVLQSPSHSLNWVFSKGFGLPFGYTLLAYGEPKSGKSLISYLLASELHRTDKDAIAIKFDTEMRGEAQLNSAWGIDPDRFFINDTNQPTEIFDKITGEIKEMLEEGAPIKMIIIDSLKAICGPKESGAESVIDHIIGDNAMVLQRGLKAILPVIRKHKIALVLTNQIVANMDGGLYGPKTKMAGGFFMKHFAEYYLQVSRDNSADGKKDLMGNALVNENIKDFKDNKEITGHKIYVKMTDSSFGVAGRSGEFTIDYNKGLINAHEEIFLLAKNLGLVEQPNNRTYIFDGVKYNSKQEFLDAIKDDKKVSNKIIQTIRDKESS
jgi:RecA/RadA recombinase